MTVCTFDVMGTPMPKGSMLKMPNGKYVAQGSAKLTRWVKEVREKGRVAWGWEGLLEGPVRVSLAFRLAPPVTQISKARWGWELPAKKPDIDKLERAVLDALTGVCWEDDAQVTALASSKSYAWDYKTGCSIVVAAIRDDEAQTLAESYRKISGLLP